MAALGPQAREALQEKPVDPGEHPLPVKLESMGAAARALEVAYRFGGIGGEHHKTWVVDQMVRALTGSRYEEWVRAAKAGEDGPETYDWDTGIAP